MDGEELGGGGGGSQNIWWLCAAGYSNNTRNWLNFTPSPRLVNGNPLLPQTEHAKSLACPRLSLTISTPCTRPKFENHTPNHNLNRGIYLHSQYREIPPLSLGFYNCHCPFPPPSLQEARAWPYEEWTALYPRDKSLSNI